MEADWEFEVGGDGPVIEACWPGFVDLRVAPERARELPEAAHLPALAATLQTINAQRSPVWTSKCDFWPALQAAEFDAGELDAPPDSVGHAMGCYIDLLPKSLHEWSPLHLAAEVCKHLCSLLAAAPRRCCRVDLVIRQALPAPGIVDVGITAYITSCGRTAGDAKATLEAALAVFADALCPHSTLQ